MIDLRSDTVTKPTFDMREAAFEAKVGDDVYEEDPAVNELEEYTAARLGKEAALFVPTGTMGNQITALTHCRPGQEVILEVDSHIFYYEGAGISALAGVQPRTIHGSRGVMDPEKVRGAIREDDIHLPETGLICLENTHNRAGGAVVPMENMQEIYGIARENEIPVHLDGARLFNASVASGVDVKDYAAHADSVQFCLSKGLGAPVGSVIAGSASFIKKARKWRKRLGGGMRQAGIIAAPGLVALKTMVGALRDDHHNAQLLDSGLRGVDGLSIENKVETNIVLVNTKVAGFTAKEFVGKLKEAGILAIPYGPYTVRLTTHHDVDREDMEEVIYRIGGIVG